MERSHDIKHTRYMVLDRTSFKDASRREAPGLTLV